MSWHSVQVSILHKVALCPYTKCPNFCSILSKFVQNIIITWIVQVLVAGQVVSHVVVRLPSSKKREAWTELQFHMILMFYKMTGGDVANLIPVVNIGSWGG